MECARTGKIGAFTPIPQTSISDSGIAHEQPVSTSHKLHNPSHRNTDAEAQNCAIHINVSKHRQYKITNHIISTTTTNTITYKKNTNNTNSSYTLFTFTLTVQTLTQYTLKLIQIHTSVHISITIIPKPTEKLTSSSS